MAHTTAEVTEIPPCDFCAHRAQQGTADRPVRPAVVDGRTIYRSWAYMCEDDFALYGVGLGLGSGQRLVVRGEGS